MEVNALKQAAVIPEYGVSGAATDKAKAAQPDNSKAKQNDNIAAPQNPILTQEDMQEITAALNKFMTSMNADLQFAVHEGTNSLIVRLVDPKSQQVLKEFPQHEYLDMLTRIREYVGALIDKKA